MHRVHTSWEEHNIRSEVYAEFVGGHASGNVRSLRGFWSD